MPDYPSKVRWDKENLVVVTVKMQKRYDMDCIKFIEGKNRRNTILAALREYMKNHPEEMKGEEKE